MNVPGTVDRAGYGPEHQAGGPEQAEKADHSQQAVNVSGCLNVGEQQLLRNRQVVLEKLDDVAVQGVRFQEQAKQADKSHRERKEGQHRIVGEARCHVSGVVGAHLASCAIDQRDDRVGHQAPFQTPDSHPPPEEAAVLDHPIPPALNLPSNAFPLPSHPVDDTVPLAMER